MYPVLNIMMCRSFAELSKALDPRKDVKTDKTSIVADAIRVVTQLRAENGQLKQLNKFLEVRASRLFRPRRIRPDICMTTLRNTATAGTYGNVVLICWLMYRSEWEQ